jgi:hypothetical protein
VAVAAVEHVFDRVERLHQVAHHLIVAVLPLGEVLGNRPQLSLAFL